MSRATLDYAGMQLYLELQFELGGPDSRVCPHIHYVNAFFCCLRSGKSANSFTFLKHKADRIIVVPLPAVNS